MTRTTKADHEFWKALDLRKGERKLADLVLDLEDSYRECDELRLEIERYRMDEERAADMAGDAERERMLMNDG